MAVACLDHFCSEPPFFLKMFAVLYVMSTMVPTARFLDLDASFLFGVSHCLAACYVHHGSDCQISWS